MVLHKYIRMQAFVVDIVANTNERTHTHTHTHTQIRSDSLSRGDCLTCRAPIDGGADGNEWFIFFKNVSFSKTSGVLVEGC